MGAATLIAGKDLKLRVRDRSVFIMGIVTPLALAYIFHLVFGGAFSAEALDLEVGLVDLDDTQVSQSLGEALSGMEAEGVLVLTDFDDTSSAEASVEDGEIGAYILLNQGLGNAAIQAQPFTIEVVGDVDSQTTTQVASSIASEFGSAIERSQLSVTTAIALSEGPPPDEMTSLGEEAALRPPAFAFADFSADTRQLDANTFFAAGMAVFFLFFTVQFGVVGILEEKQGGTLARLLAAPIGHTSVVAGKAILSFTLGLISMTVLVVATHYLMDAEWGPPLGVALLVIAGVLAATAIMGVIAATATSADGAANLGAIIAVMLGMLGGTFFPIGQGNEFLARLSYLTPHAWFMRGLSDISGGAEWTEALPAVGALLLFTLVFGTVAWVLLQRKLTR
ncbi:MAG TPA: ABC transporter permease [Acidimicrobiia bacterium]|nr:ABC transporter permease [Acidimicrobiia bacterium]